MKKLIVYYSMTENTDYVAKAISKKLDADLLRLYPKKEYPNKGFKKFFWGGKSALMGEEPSLENYKFDENKYDTIIIGSPVWASMIAPPIKTFLIENKDKLNNKTIAAFLCYSGMGANKAMNKLKKISQKELKAELMLIDPKEKQNNENEIKINEFCELLRG